MEQMKRPSLLAVVHLPFPDGCPLAQFKSFALVFPFQENPPLLPNGCKLVMIGANPSAEIF
jgi:hypothetical protein